MERRALLTEPRQAELDLVAEVELTPWFPLQPRWRGWYDLRGPGPFLELPGRLWFDGEWRLEPGAAALSLRGDGWQWRGLKEPPPFGYDYDVQSAAPALRRAVPVGWGSR